jgi:hypothetical protein
MVINPGDVWIIEEPTWPYCCDTTSLDNGNPLAVTTINLPNTTDAVSLVKSFKGWNRDQVDALISECVSVIEKHATVRIEQRYERYGIRPVCATVFLKDFKRALQLNDIGTPEMHCVIHCATACQVWGKVRGHERIEFVFDRGEPFAGHIQDRLSNRGARKTTPELKDWIASISHQNSKDSPPLQAADLLAWCVNDMYDGGIKRNWQRRMLRIDRDEQTFRYRTLSRPNKQRLSVVQAWNLPSRKPLR